MSSLYGKVSSGASGFNPYSSKRFLQGTKDFLQSNSLVAKLAFLVLIIFLFIILLRAGIGLLNNYFDFSKDPILLKGTVEGENLVVIEQNPNATGSIPILRSKDARDGLEFTWSIWVWVKTPPLNSDPTARPNQYRHIFSKGNDNIDTANCGEEVTSTAPCGMVSPNNAPGLYISPNYRDLVLVMNTFNNLREEIIIPDFPIEKWLNVIIRCNQRTVDIFINGMLTKSHVLSSVPKQNYDNVYIGLNGGFTGKVSQLQYFAYALGTNKIQNIVENGPNLKVIGTQLLNTKPYYLSFKWFFPDQPNNINL